MQVTQFLSPLLVGKDVEVVVARLPEWMVILLQVSGDQLFQHLNRGAEFVGARFAHEQVNVLRHGNVSEDVEAVPATDFLESMLEG